MRYKLNPESKITFSMGEILDMNKPEIKVFDKDYRSFYISKTE